MPVSMRLRGPCVLFQMGHERGALSITVPLSEATTTYSGQLSNLTLALVACGSVLTNKWHCNIRGCLKRVAGGPVVEYTRAYEPPCVSHGLDRPPVGLYQRSRACRKAGRSPALIGHAAGLEC